jgi:penicillin amidase
MRSSAGTPPQALEEKARLVYTLPQDLSGNPVEKGGLSMAKRHRIWRIITWFFVLLVVASATLVAGACLWLRSTVAPLEGAWSVQGLDNPVTIRFDEYARPMVYAETFTDAFFAQGWLHASHRLWQMELLRRAGQGRMSELLGSGLLDTDRELWMRGVPQLARELEANASADMRIYIEAYIRGVNAALNSGIAVAVELVILGKTPAPWTPADVYALGAVMAYQSANNGDNELLRLAVAQEVGVELAGMFLPDEGAQPGFPYVVPPGNGAALARVLARREAANALSQTLLPGFALGSNGWVVASARAKGGNALFAFDSHDALGLPNLFYAVHLYVGDGRQIHGWSVAGLPGVINGFNERIAWGFTNIGDTQDCFLETRDDENPLLFRDGGAWYEAQTETIEIPVLGQDSPEILTLIHTRNGTLISEDPPIALRWTGRELGGMGIDSLLRFNLARNWEEFSAALDEFPAPALAATYADVEGNIGFRVAGRFPVRGAGEGLVPLPGDVAGNRWQGHVPTRELPMRYNPPEGFLAAANARVNAPGEGPLISADNAPGYRIRRIQQVLAQRSDFTVDDMRALQMDWQDTQAALLLPTMLESLEQAELPANDQKAMEILVAWQEDFIAAPEEAAPLLFQAWYRALAIEVFQPAFGAEVLVQLLKNNYVLNHALDRLILREKESAWWRGERTAIIRAAFDKACGEITAVQGPDPAAWRLDRMHRVMLEHELGKAVPQLGWFFNAPPAPWGGSTSTVGRARYRYSQAYDVRAAATVRVAGEMKPTGPVMAAVIPGGQSGHPMSKHYLDQFPAWLAGELLPVTPATGEANTSLLTLSPRK